MTQEKTEPDPLSKFLSRIWIAISQFLAVTALLSLNDQWVHWAKFFKYLVETWQSTVRPIFQFCFGWIEGAISILWTSFSFPPWFYDYLAFGSIILVGPYIRTLTAEYDEDWVWGLVGLILLAPCCSLIWPLLAFTIAVTLFSSHSFDTDDDLFYTKRHRLTTKRVVINSLTTIILFFAILIVNYLIQ